MVEILGPVGVLTVALALSWSGSSHIFHYNSFRRTLLRQAIIPPGVLSELAAAALIVLELTVALATWTVLLSPGAAASLSGGLALLTIGFLITLACYGGLLLRFNPAAPCGCSTHDVPTNIWVPLRAIALAIMLVPVAGGFSPSVLPPAGFNSVLVVLAATSLATLIWELPSAMHVPSDYQAILEIRRRRVT